MFQAASALIENIEPQAFVNWSDPANQAQPGNAKSILPYQCRFTILQEARPIYLADPELQAVFRDLPGGLPPGGQIPLEETKLLCNLFAQRSGFIIPQTEQPSAQGGSGGGGMGGGGNAYMMKRGMGGVMEMAAYKAPFKYVDEVPIDVNANAFDLKRR